MAYQENVPQPNYQQAASNIGQDIGAMSQTIGGAVDRQNQHDKQVQMFKNLMADDNKFRNTMGSVLDEFTKQMPEGSYSPEEIQMMKTELADKKVPKEDVASHIAAFGIQVQKWHQLHQENPDFISTKPMYGYKENDFDELNKNALESHKKGKQEKKTQDFAGSVAQQPGMPLGPKTIAQGYAAGAAPEFSKELGTSIAQTEKTENTAEHNKATEGLGEEKIALDRQKLEALNEYRSKVLELRDKASKYAFEQFQHKSSDDQSKEQRAAIKIQREIHDTQAKLDDPKVSLLGDPETIKHMREQLDQEWKELQKIIEYRGSPRQGGTTTPAAGGAAPAAPATVKKDPLGIF